MSLQVTNFLVSETSQAVIAFLCILIIGFSLDQNNCILHLHKKKICVCLNSILHVEVSNLHFVVFLLKFSVYEKHIIICSNNPV